MVFDATADDIFGLKYPSYREAGKWVASTTHGSEYGRYAHDLLKKMFEAQHDPEVIKEAGTVMLQNGSMQSMQCNFYNYHAITTTMCNNGGIDEHAYREWWGDTQFAINKVWDGNRIASALVRLRYAASLPFRGRLRRGQRTGEVFRSF